MIAQESFPNKRKLLIYKYIFFPSHSHSIVAGGLPEMS